MVRVFTNNPGNLGSIPGPVIPKTQKMVLYATLLYTQHYKERVKWSNPGKGVASSSTPWCSSYRKGSLWVTHDYRYIYIYMCVCEGERIGFSFIIILKILKIIYTLPI